MEGILENQNKLLLSIYFRKIPLLVQTSTTEKDTEHKSEIKNIKVS